MEHRSAGVQDTRASRASHELASGVDQEVAAEFVDVEWKLARRLTSIEQEDRVAASAP